MNNQTPAMNRQYSQKAEEEEWVQDNPDEPFESTLVRAATLATPTRLQTIRQLEEENKTIKSLLTEAANDRQVCIDELNLIKNNPPSKGGRKSRKKRGGRKSRKKRRRRKTKKRKTNRKRRKTNRRKRKTKRRR